jgi:hypothetical protein
MKSTALITAIALASAAFCVGANAQTGRPSTEEAPAAHVAVVQGDAQVGSYARYLMLSGMPRDEAIVQAAPFDRPAPRPFVQRFARARTNASKTDTSTVQQ